MKVTAKCHNYSGCLLAYRGEEIELEPGAALVCPDCGKPVTIVKSSGSRIVKGIGVVVLIAALAAAAYVTVPRILKNMRASRDSDAAATPAQSPRSGNASLERSPSTPVSMRATRAAEPPPEITAPVKLDLDIGSAENKTVKAEVLKRIDVMPNVSQANKDKLYNSVERARSMGRVLTIPFTSGKTSLSPADVQTIKTQLESPTIMKLRDDPTAVFVILGYADPKGDQKKNIDFSQARADAVLAALREKCGVQNVMHAVAMGGSTLLDSQKLEKNRIVEVWAVLP
jgi:outer membrane protein OmpA-like peptidoglycan-associated protein